MAGAGVYRVGASETYQTIQAAIDQLKSDQGVSAFTETQYILITDSNSYGPVSVDSLTPTIDYKLEIRADVGVNPIISASKTTNAWSGISIDNVDHVVIQGLRIEGFSHNIALNECDNHVINKCVIENASLYGIFAYVSTRVQVLNTSVKGKYAVGIIRSDLIALVHSTIYGEEYGLVVDFEGSTTGVTNTDVFSLVNCIVSAKQSAIHIQEDLLEYVGYSDGNVYHTGQTYLFSSFYQAEDKKNIKLISSLDEWGRLAYSETNSIVSDPEFLKNRYSKDFTSGLLIDETSPAISGGVDITTATVFLPLWFLPSYVYTDRLGNNRDPNTNSTPGAIQIGKSTDYGYFDNLLDFSLQTSEYELDSDILYGVDKSLRQIDKALPKWNASVKSGHFFHRDSPYYLYSQKRGMYLQEATWSKITLPTRTIVDTVSIGSSELDWIQVGNTLWANHHGATLSKPYNENIRVHGVEPSWEDTSHAFIDYERAREYPIEEYPIEYYLPHHPLDGAPIVITDSTITDYTDRTLIPEEFFVSYDPILEKSKLNLQGRTNLFQNPHFHNEGSGWVSNGTFEGTSEHLPLFGSKYLRHTGLDEQVLSQTVWRTDLNKDMVISFYVHSHSCGQLTLSTTIYDEDEVSFGSEYQTVNLPCETSEDRWYRYALFMRGNDESVFETHGADYDVLLENHNLLSLDNAGTPKVKFTLTSDGFATSELDCMMAFEGNYLPRYAGVSYGDETTIEIEGSDGQLYNISDLSLVSVLNPQHTGFLSIGGYPLDQFDSNAPADATVLSDSYAPARADTSTFLLPWAKISGPQKLFNTSKEYTIESVGLPRELNLAPYTPTLRLIECRPDPITVRQGLKKSFTVFCVDDRKNPYSYENVSLTLESSNGRYPGVLGLRELSSPSILGLSLTTKTDPSGAITAEIYAPDKTERSFETSDISTMLETYYSVDRTNNGNITLLNLRNNTYLDLIGDETSEIASIVPGSSYGTIDFTQTPVFGTVSVYVDGTSSYDKELFESVNTNILDNSFYVDYASKYAKLPSRYTGNARVYYDRALAWVDPVVDTRIHLDPILEQSITSEIVLGHDSKVYLTATSEAFSATFPVNIRNKYTRE